MTRNARPVELPLELAPSGAPLRHRVADALIEMLRTGHLRPGDTLPATRTLAAELAISRTAVLAAYDEMAAAGFIHAVGGSATVVSPGADLAARAGALVIEDDYDGEFRYDVRGLPALHSLTGGPDVVAYLGTASKIVSPGLRVAWLIAPADLRQPARDALERTDETISAPTGDALAHFIASGHLASHLARTARTYAARRRALIAGLRGHVPELRISGVDAGLHLVADLPSGVDEAAVQQRLEAAGLGVEVLGQSATEPLARQALVCGYALLPETQAATAAAAIARSLART